MKHLILAFILAFASPACGKFNSTPGPKGDQGEVGAQGEPGTPATAPQVTPIQLCPNKVVVYPTSFPETALCINQKLYGVMWNGSQSWLAELPPGDYSSTSPQGCNLRIGSGCTVTN